MRLDKNTGKTIAFACVILFAGILFSTWVLPAATEDKSEQAVVMPVMLNNPQKIIESPAMKADPQKLYPAAYSLRVPLNTSQIDETVVQARNLFLKNVSEDVEYLFNLKIDSVIMEKYAEAWRLTPGKVTVPSEPVWEPDDAQSGGLSPQTGSGPEGTLSEPGAEDPESGSTGTSEEPQDSSLEPSDEEKELEAKLQQEEYQKRLRKYEQYLYEEKKGDAFSLDILFTDAKSTTWRITACGYADEIIALHCVKEDIEVTPVSIFQERNLDLADIITTKMNSAIALFRSRIDSVKAVNDIYDNGYYLDYIELCVESPSSELYWNIYGWIPETRRILVAGFRGDTNTPVCYGLVPLSENLSELLIKYSDNPEDFSSTNGYGY